MRSELRKWPRQGAKAALQVRWETAEGLLHLARAQVVDFSDGGLALEINHRIPPGSQVMLQDSRGGLGWARVRYCRDRRLRFVVGLELTEGRLIHRLAKTAPAV